MKAPFPEPAHIRLVEAYVFAATEPVDEATLAGRLPEGADLAAIMELLAEHYAPRGIHLVKVGGRWTFRTAPDLAPQLRIERPIRRRLSRAMVETLAVVAYHQPVTRAEIEEIRGVSLSKGVLDALLEAGWVRPGRRRRTPGRPLTWITTDAFMQHFGLESLDDLPGVKELEAAGLLDARPASIVLGLGESEPLSLPDEDEAQAEMLGQPLPLEGEEG
jgi:segregation and condensation protein B